MSECGVGLIQATFYKDVYIFTFHFGSPSLLVPITQEIHQNVTESKTNEQF
jgi:hypothetical protein